MNKKHDVVLFDLDGTLIDTSRGIFNSVRYAESRLKLPPVSEAELKKFVGPPPLEMYQKVYNISRERAMEALVYHRTYGREKAIFEAKVYPGIEAGLRRLKQRGKTLGVVTLKAEDSAQTILTYYDIANYFSKIVGMNQDENLTKADLIEVIIRFLRVEKKRVVLVGDSIYDFEGAIRAGIDFVPVLYGFGFFSRTELKRKEVIDIIRNPFEIGQIN